MDSPLTIRRWSEICSSGQRGLYVDYYSALGGTLWLLNSGQFKVENFLEFCNFLEATVLFTRLCTSPNPCPSPGHSLRDVDQFTKELAESGVLTFVSMPHMPSEERDDLTEAEKAFHDRFGKMRMALRSQGRVEIVETFFGIAAHAFHGMTLQPSVYNRSAYLDCLGVCNSIRATLSFREAYAGLSAAAEKAVRELAEYRAAEEIYIPPIPALVMSRASDLRDVPSVVLELRERFAPVRAAFTEFENVISDSSTPIKTSLRAMTLLKTVVEEVSSTFDFRGKRVLAQWSDLADLIPTDVDFDAEDAKSITKLLLGKPLELVLSRLRRRRFLPLYSLRKEYLKLQNMQGLVKKLWGYELTESDIRLSSRYLMSPDTVTKGKARKALIHPPTVLGFDIWGNKHGNVGAPSHPIYPIDKQ